MKFQDVFSNNRNLSYLAEMIMKRESELELTSSNYRDMLESKRFWNYRFEELEEMHNEYAAALFDFEEWLKALPYNQRAIMRLRYVDGLSWRKVAIESNYSEDWCRHVNSHALKTTQQNTSRHGIAQKQSVCYTCESSVCDCRSNRSKRAREQPNRR